MYPALFCKVYIVVDKFIHQTKVVHANQTGIFLMGSINLEGSGCTHASDPFSLDAEISFWKAAKITDVSVMNCALRVSTK